MEAKIKHLEFIQGVINRLSSKSFFSRGWCVTLVAAAFSINNFDGSGFLILLPYCLIVIFWLLDSHYLYLERCFRALYEDVAGRENENIDFLMRIDRCRNDFFKTLFRSHFKIFYLPAGIVVSFILFFSGGESCSVTDGGGLCCIPRYSLAYFES